MQGERHLFLLACMVAVAITVSLAFNIDMKNTDVYHGEKEDFYGYKVVQLESGGTKGIVVTAPLWLNGSGKICKHENNSTKWCFTGKDAAFEDISQEDKKIPVKHLGLSIAADSTQFPLTVCSPSVAHECNENSYLNSVCYEITNDLLQGSSFTPDFQECTKKTVDLVFLFDGSASMTEDEFTQNKYFIVDIMNSLKNTSIKFAAVQFSSGYRKVFDFNDYEAGRAHANLMKEQHMKSLTNTHKALAFVMKEVLENPDAGASPDATKVLVLITDGDPSDVDRDRIIERYDNKKIIRFVIGVKVALMDKFRVIASEPSDKHAFKIENYNGLKGILENFQKRIFNMEGSSVARAGDITGEMSQSGFSAVYYKDTLILGSVGSDNWQGSLQELHVPTLRNTSRGGESKRLNENQVTLIHDPHMQNDSYMGYSVSVGQKNDVPLYFAGAPRFEHRGQVVLFRQNGKDWKQAERLDGDQIGSYFGAELCSVDINSDGNTDFLLVGAPLFYQPQEKREGQIYVYTLTDEMKLRSQLNVTVPSMGRFGTTISSLADLNGDGLRDVAVGAPLEDNNSGAVYVYLGDRSNGIRGSFSQRIMGKKIPPGLRFFGLAIDGDMDLGKDGLPDIVIGSQGAAVVLRSRPVFDVKTRLSFLPKEISIESFNCLEKGEKNLPLVTITTCFEVAETTKSGAVAMGSYVNISYRLIVDPTRQTYRGFFDDIEKSRTYTNSHMLTKETCFNHTILMPRCVKDTLSPLTIKLNYSQVDSESESAILDMDSRRHAVVEIPFEKLCAQNDTCIADIEVDFNFMTPVFLVSENNYFNLTVTLSNHGDDSYNTSLTLYYPQGLSFSRMTQLRTESSRQTLHSCHGLEGVLDRTICGISLPVYRSRSAATFIVSFYMTTYKWNDTVSMTVIGTSDNSNITERSSQTKTIPVQFDVKLAITVRQDITNYLNFTTEDEEPKKLVTVYKIDNPGLQAFPVTVTLVFPTLLEYDFELSNYQITVQENITQCNITGVKSEYCLPEKSCKFIQCDYFTLDKESTTEFTLSGDVQFKHLKEYAKNLPFLKRYVGHRGEVRFKSFVQVRYDEKRYILNGHKQENKDNSAQEKSDATGIWRDNGPNRKWAEVRVEFIIPAEQLLIILTGVTVGFVLLVIIAIIMIKFGFFKRKTPDEQEIVAVQAANSCKSSNESEGKPDCEKEPPENEVLLDDGQTDGSKPPADTV